MAVHVTLHATHLSQHVIMRSVEGENVAVRPVSALVLVVVHEHERVTRVQHA